jgi:hypothetical protein
MRLGRAEAGLGDRYRILIDLKTGLPVSVESLFEGKPLDRTTVDELTVGGAIPEEMFTYTPAADVRVLDNKTLQATTMGLPGAIARLTFPLWAPAGFHGDVSVMPDLENGGDVAMFSVGDAFPSSVRESVSRPLTGDGRRMVQEGTEILVIDEDGQRSATVALIRDGTRIEVSGSVAAEKLAERALSFERVPEP